MADMLPLGCETIRIQAGDPRAGRALCTQLTQLGFETDLVYSDRGWEVEVALRGDWARATLD